MSSNHPEFNKHYCIPTLFGRENDMEIAIRHKSRVVTRTVNHFQFSLFWNFFIFPWNSKFFQKLYKLIKCPPPPLTVLHNKNFSTGLQWSHSSSKYDRLTQNLMIIHPVIWFRSPGFHRCNGQTQLFPVQRILHSQILQLFSLGTFIYYFPHISINRRGWKGASHSEVISFWLSCPLSR